nr:hypothetical protein OG409_36790 [Streptomyces sp. NBC_00974]
MKLRDQVAETKRRYAEINEKAAQRSKITQEHGEAFNRVHDVVRDEFFMRFVELAKSISGAPEPERPGEEEIESTGGTPTAIRIEAMSAGIANAIRGAAAGGAAGAAVGGAAAYGAFTAAALFGTASTGTAISALAGVAATNATLTLLGGAPAPAPGRYGRGRAAVRGRADCGRRLSGRRTGRGWRLEFSPDLGSGTGDGPRAGPG